MSDLRDTLISVLQGVAGIKLAILYGSAARGCLRPESDIDIAVLCDQPLDAEHKMDLLGRLQCQLKHAVDLVDLFNLHGTLLKEVVTKGEVLVGEREVFTNLAKRMIYDQADFAPLVRRTLLERQKRFVDG